MTVPDLSTREGRDQLRALEGTVPTTEVIKAAVTFPRDRLGEPLSIPADRFDAWLDQVRRDAAKEALDATEARADRAEAALQRVRAELDTWMHRCQTEQTMRALDDVHRALDDGDPTTPCGRGPCALGAGHAGNCRM